MIIQATKKPVTIACIKLTEKSIREVYEFVFGDLSVNSLPESERWEVYEDSVQNRGMAIPTLEGDVRASIGDYIIKGVNGEFYPCKPDIFHKTYDIKD